MYNLDQFALMFAGKICMEAYLAEIARSVRLGDAVVDLGCGPRVFALLACKAGARRVYAIDMDGVVDFGRQLASANGFGDRILFLRGDSRQIHLPECVNVHVSDVRGVLPLRSNAIDTIEDAGDRFLEKYGCLLPSRDTLFAAIVELPEHIAGEAALIKLPKLPRNFHAEISSALYRVHYIWFGEDVCSQHRNMHQTS